MLARHGEVEIVRLCKCGEWMLISGEFMSSNMPRIWCLSAWVIQKCNMTRSPGHLTHPCLLNCQLGDLSHVSFFLSFLMPDENLSPSAIVNALRMAKRKTPCIHHSVRYFSDQLISEWLFWDRLVTHTANAIADQCIYVAHGMDRSAKVLTMVNKSISWVAKPQQFGQKNNVQNGECMGFSSLPS